MKVASAEFNDVIAFSREETSTVHTARETLLLSAIYVFFLEKLVTGKTLF